MTLLWISLAWVFASAGVATLPLRNQYIPGVILLAIAPVLIVLIGFQVGWIASLCAIAAFVSMFRNPLRYILAKLRGQNPELPPEMRREVDAPAPMTTGASTETAS